MSDLGIEVDGVELAANWTDESPTTRAALADALPLTGEATRWGDELYFPVPVDEAAENATTEVPVGAVAYWPGGDVLCLFWGPTPASHDTEPRAAAPVNVVGRIEDVSPLSRVEGGATVTVERR